MAFIVNQQSTFKHFCKICKRGFGCGRALGGHMRAHGIGNESWRIDDDDPSRDWEDQLGGNTPPSSKRYSLSTNPNRLKSCRVCENCGEEFWSWKSFLEHGKCSSEDAESLVSSPASDGHDGVTRRGGGWSKRKRSLRAKGGNFNTHYSSSEEEDLANCLLMLSNATVDPFVTEPEGSCASASKVEERKNALNFIAPIACSVSMAMDKAKGVAKGLFECKACKKEFNSHQALGGHRASHKNVKGCFAARVDRIDDSQAYEDHVVIRHEEFFPTKSTSTMEFDQGTSTPLASKSKRKSKIHECSICHRVFSSGPALGGHKRCHWITSNAIDTSPLAKFHQFQDHMEQILQRPKLIDNSEQFDLNRPAPANDLVHWNPINPSSFDVCTEMYLQPWISVDAKEKEDNQHQLQAFSDNNNDKNNNCNSSTRNADNEADGKVKLENLSELTDSNMSGGSSPWLQVGIGSTTNVGSEF